MSHATHANAIIFARLHIYLVIVRVSMDRFGWCTLYGDSFFFWAWFDNCHIQSKYVNGVTQRMHSPHAITIAGRNSIYANDTVIIIMANINLPCETISIVAVGEQKISLSWLLAVDCSQINKMPLQRAPFSSDSECIRHGPLGWVKPRHTIIHLKWQTHRTQFKMTIADLRMCTCCMVQHSVFAQCTRIERSWMWIYCIQANIAAERAGRIVRAGQ